MALDDRIEDAAENLAGNAKEAVGKATDNEQLEAAGTTDQLNAGVGADRPASVCPDDHLEAGALVSSHSSGEPMIAMSANETRTSTGSERPTRLGRLYRSGTTASSSSSRSKRPMRDLRSAIVGR